MPVDGLREDHVNNQLDQRKARGNVDYLAIKGASQGRLEIRESRKTDLSTDYILQNLDLSSLLMNRSVIESIDSGLVDLNVVR